MKWPWGTCELSNLNWRKKVLNTWKSNLGKARTIPQTCSHLKVLSKMLPVMRYKRATICSSHISICHGTCVHISRDREADTRLCHPPIQTESECAFVFNQVAFHYTYVKHFTSLTCLLGLLCDLIRNSSELISCVIPLTVMHLPEHLQGTFSQNIFICDTGTTFIIIKHWCQCQTDC